MIDLKKQKIHLGLYKGDTTPPHKHAFLELAYVVSGEAIHIADDNKMHLRRGDYFVIDYGTEHTYARVSEEPFAVVNCLFLPEFIDAALCRCDSFEKLSRHYLIRMQIPSPKKGNFPYLFHDEDGAIYRLITQMMEEYQEKKAGYIELLRSDLISVLIRSLRSLAAKTSTESEEIRKACLYIGEHLDEKLSLASLALSAHYSVPHFCQKFKAETGSGFTEFVEQLRAAEACRLLAETSARVIDIAARVGYRDTESFGRMFRRRCGMTPSEYRSASRGQ